jgi:UDP-N-acetylmuramate: L-alanyl-gamma-D-glutamyl-meso-diaminopimelate ligase
LWHHASDLMPDVVTPPAQPPPTAGRGRGRRAHFIGICGNAMGGIARTLARSGWTVTGSSDDCHSPMLEYLRDNGIGFHLSHHPSNVPAETDVVIVAKRIPAWNVELQHVLERGIPHRSFPEFLRDEFLSRSRNAVVAGGVGKTTTTAMLAWILEYAGLQPDYLIGGHARNFADPSRFEGCGVAVLEGDEYSASFDDPRPKFLHYLPEVAVITNIIEDHPDVYPNLDAVCAVFRQLVDSLPANGCLIIPDWDEAAVRVASGSRARVLSTGREANASERITAERLLRDRSCFRLLNVDFEIPLCGHMNVSNAAMAALAAAQFGVHPSAAAEALWVFRGVRNRQEEQQLGSVTLVLDKASHPHSLHALAEALRQHFPGRRLVSLIQPRATGGREWVYQRQLPAALSRFDKVILTGSEEYRPHNPRPWMDTPFSIDLLAATLASLSVDTVLAPTPGEIPAVMSAQLQDDDVVVLSVLEHSQTLVTTVVQALEAFQLRNSQRSNLARVEFPSAL